MGDLFCCCSQQLGWKFIRSGHDANMQQNGRYGIVNSRVYIVEKKEQRRMMILNDNIKNANKYANLHILNTHAQQPSPSSA